MTFAGKYPPGGETTIACPPDDTMPHTAWKDPHGEKREDVPSSFSLPTTPTANVVSTSPPSAALAKTTDGPQKKSSLAEGRRSESPEVSLWKLAVTATRARCGVAHFPLRSLEVPQEEKWHSLPSTTTAIASSLSPGHEDRVKEEEDKEEEKAEEAPPRPPPTGHALQGTDALAMQESVQRGRAEDDQGRKTAAPLLPSPSLPLVVESPVVHRTIPSLDLVTTTATALEACRDDPHGVRDATGPLPPSLPTSRSPSSSSLSTENTLLTWIRLFLRHTTRRRAIFLASIPDRYAPFTSAASCCPSSCSRTRESSNRTNPASSSSVLERSGNRNLFDTSSHVANLHPALEMCDQQYGGLLFLEILMESFSSSMKNESGEG